MTIRLSIVVPCYNEAGNIPLILDRFLSLLAGRDDTELLLVDNGSTDDSARVLRAALADPKFRFARVVTVLVNQGYGHGIVTGLRAARGEFLAWTHADLQTDPRDVLLAFERMMQSARPAECLVRGRRQHRPWLDAFFTWGMGRLASAALGVKLHDINAQPKLFHRSFFEAMTSPPSDFSLDLYVLYLASRRNLRIVEQPVEFGRRLHGQAKGGSSLRGKWKLTRRSLAYILRLRQTLKSEVTLPREPARRVKPAA